MSDLLEEQSDDEDLSGDVINDYLIFQLGEQAFCIGVSQVRDVLSLQKLTQVPLSEDAISGVMNLRGHIVTAIDAHKALDITRPEGDQDLSVVVEFQENLYSIIVDKVRDVINIIPTEIDSNPSILEGRLREISSGVIKRDNELIICLDVEKLFNSVKSETAEE